MPKKGRDFPSNLNFNCATELRQALVALSYLRGDGGSFAAPARDILTEGVAKTIAAMDERRRRDYQEILQNVQAREALEAENKKPPG